MIPQATAYETDVKVLRDRVNALRTENETLREQVRYTEAKLATQIERADYAWRNTNVIEKARQEEMAKRDALAAAIRDVFPAAHRLALELECLLLDTKDTAVMSKWWDSAHEALEQWREFLREDANKATASPAPTSAA